jgi:murein DD-endopeptidase MepM/ murein hydrolase activator NlpD
MRPQFKFILTAILVALFSFSAHANVTTYRVKWGDTLYSILSDKFSPQHILNIDKEIKKLIPDFTLRKGTIIKESEDRITLAPNNLTDIAINKIGDDFELDVIKYPVEKVNTIVEGVISSSLVEAVTSVGESVELAFMLAGIYEWEIDFFHALRKGDSFRILVEKKFARGKFQGYGKILAADFLNQGRFIRALYYETEKTKGYFKPDGTSMKKGFLKAPLRYSRISSGYTSRRLHPVFKRYRPHYGVDYAAPRGTPVYATADGVVTAKGYKKYNGNYVKIKHMNGYETLYLHLYKFKRGLRRGKHVRQGDLIAYVGSTGASTGPHLDYRIRKNGRYLNPLRFKAPEKKLPADELLAFKKDTEVFAMKIDGTYSDRHRFSFIR